VGTGTFTPPTLNLVKDGGGVWTLSGNNSYAGTTAVNQGTLLVNGTHTGGGAYTVASGAALGGTGTIETTVNVSAGGALTPGVGVGTLSIDAATIGGTLEIDYNSTAQTIDMLDISGALDITGGSISFQNLGAGTLTGGPYVFASYDSLIGNPFSSITGLPAGYSIDYHYLGGNQLALVTALAGDFDSDGDVDGADFVAWQTSFPTAGGASLAQGDADGDGDVDGGDFAVWQTHFPGPAGPGAAPVPEPVGFIAIAIGCVGLMLVRHRQALK
jgi:autotransporter-associated beta strand protein